MPIRGLIELSPSLDPERLAALVGAAHDTCADGGVVLLVCDAGIDGDLLDRAREADFVIADSGRLSAELLANGVRHMRAEEGLVYMRSLAPAPETSAPPRDVVPLDAAREQRIRRHHDSRTEV